MNQKRRRSFAFSNLFITLILVAVYCLWALGRPIAPVAPIKSTLKLASSTTSNELSWPSKGQSAVGASPSGVLATFGDQKPVPTASVAKVFTALVVLQQRPLAKGQPGPSIVVNEADIASYQRYVAGDGTVIPVTLGESLTQYQMLQAMLLPSANNISDSLAIWAFGSLENYSKFANNYIRQLGLTNTVIGTDASGYDASTVSTAHDLVLLGQAAMRNPVIAEIVGQSSANLPGAGNVQNRNFLLGPDGLAGIKTGSTIEAGGVFLAAKQVVINEQPLTLVSAIVGAETTFQAQVESVPLLRTVQENFAETLILPKGSIVGQYKSPWGKTVRAITTEPLTTLAWKGSKIPIEVNLKGADSKAKSGDVTGSITIPRSSVSTAKSVPVVLDGEFGKPSFTWRLTRPF